MNRISALIFIILFAFSALAAACRSRSNTDANGSQATLDLAGSKQGQSVGFVDADGDGILDKAVGAPYSVSKAGDIGSILIYKGTASGYSTIPSIILTGGDNFGASFLNIGDADGDGKDDFAVGAIHGTGDETGGTSVSGTVTIYKGGGNGKILKTLAGEGAMDKFGFSTAAGDLNGDGMPDLVVGAPFNTNDPALYQRGAVYVYLSNGGVQNFTDPAALYASSASKGLGWAVAAGDVNSDGVADLLISASGKVLVFFGDYSFSPSLDAPDIAISSSASGFGKSIAVIGDVDGVPGGEIAIGAPNASVNSYRDTGSLYLIKGAAAGTIDADASPAELLVRIDGEAGFNRFGASITVLGDIDLDGRPDFAVGGPMADVSADAGDYILSGKVYFFKGKDIAPAAGISAASVFNGKVKNQAYGASLASESHGKLLIGAPRGNSDTGGADMVHAATGQAVTGGSSGGASGGSGECH